MAETRARCLRGCGGRGGARNPHAVDPRLQVRQVDAAVDVRRETPTFTPPGAEARVSSASAAPTLDDEVNRGTSLWTSLRGAIFPITGPTPEPFAWCNSPAIQSTAWSGRKNRCPASGETLTVSPLACDQKDRACEPSCRAATTRMRRSRCWMRYSNRHPPRFSSALAECASLQNALLGEMLSILVAISSKTSNTRKSRSAGASTSAAKWTE